MPRGNAKEPTFDEVATTRDGRDITRGYVDPLQIQQPQDSILIGRGGGNYRTYEELLRDDQVAATFQQRRLAVISTDWEVEAGGESSEDAKAADFMREQLDHIKFDNATDKMLFGRFFGFAVAEALWARDGSYIVLDSIKVRNRRRFAFMGDGSMRLLTSDKPTGEVLPDRKFWVFQCGSDNDDELYGLGLAHWVYWPVQFKRNGMKFWLIFLEKFGQPTAWGKFPLGAGEQEKTKLLAALQAIQADSGIITPEGMLIELLEAARSGTADYQSLLNKMDAAISKVMIGQTMTADATAAGLGSSQAQVHMTVRQDLVEADADLVCHSFNLTIGRWLTEWNFPNAKTPLVSRRIEEPEDLRFTAYRDQVLAKMVPISRRYVYEKYGIPEPDPGEDLVWSPFDLAAAGASGSAGSSGSAEFAEAAGGSRDILPPGHVEQLQQRLGPIVDEWIATARILASEAKDLVDFNERLQAIHPEIDLDEFTRHMRLGRLAAELAGRADVLEEGS